MGEIIIGTVFSVETTVTEDMLAINVGSGDVSVYATPMMLSLMEEAASKCLLQFLEEGMTSVGTMISSTHATSTPLFAKVMATAEVTAVDGRRVSFKILAKDDAGLIGEGTHERFIVNREKFNAKAKAKL